MLEGIIIIFICYCIAFGLGLFLLLKGEIVKKFLNNIFSLITAIIWTPVVFFLFLLIILAKILRGLFDWLFYGSSRID